MNRPIQLQMLAASLAGLVEVLRLDDSCQWLNHFESNLHSTNKLIEVGFTADQLSDLSASIMHVYGGMCSFNDYGPFTYDASSGRYVPIPGTADFERLSQEVYDRALSLRVIGKV